MPLSADIANGDQAVYTQYNNLRADALNLHALSSTDAVAIASGAITVTSTYSYYALSAESGTADDLDTITAGTGIGVGDVVILKATATHRISVTTSGNIASKFTLTGDAVLTLRYTGSSWVSIGGGGGQYVLEAATGITLLGGYMSTAFKQAATWTEPATNKANAYDDNTGTYASNTSFLVNTPTIIQVDFGGDVVLDRIDIYFVNNTYYRPDRVYIYASDTGAFTGEETTLVNYYTPTADGWSQIALPYPYQARYWRVKAYKNGNDYCRIYEVNFHYGTTLAVMGVPWGCVVELWNGASSVASQRSESLTKPGLVEFTAAVTSVDKLTITRPDGTTAWLEFAITPTTGIVYALFKDE